ncbi:MAG: hypothetical protein K1X55_04695 [Chitinophagales bacterium]|nr:hypothetical protein [Chitinophagales bacterium]
MKNIIASICFIVLGFVLGWFLKPKDTKPLSDCSKEIDLAERKQAVLVEQLIKTGDTLLYDELKEKYEMKVYDFIGIAMIMANKYNYTDAYADVFEGFHDMLRSGSSVSESFNFSNYDERTKKIALEYLDIAVSRGNRNATERKCQYDKNCDYKKLIDSIYDSWKVHQKNPNKEK